MEKDYFGIDPRMWKLMVHTDDDSKKGEILVLDTSRISIGGGAHPIVKLA